MKLLLDQGLPRSAAPLLSQRGIDTIHVGEIGMATAEDAEILARGRADQRIVVTLEPTVSGIWSLDPLTGDLHLLNHALYRFTRAGCT